MIGLTQHAYSGGPRRGISSPMAAACEQMRFGVRPTGWWEEQCERWGVKAQAHHSTRKPGATSRVKREVIKTIVMELLT